MDPVQHFELPYDSRERAKRFYAEAFGWGLFDLPGSGYTLASTVATEPTGMPKRPGAINGGLLPRGAVQAPTLFVKAGDLRARLKAVRAAGGTVLTEPQEMGPVVFARIRDTEGNVLAVFEDRPAAVRAEQEAAGARQAAAPKKAAGGAKRTVAKPPSRGRKPKASKPSRGSAKPGKPAKAGKGKQASKGARRKR